MTVPLALSEGKSTTRHLGTTSDGIVERLVARITNILIGSDNALSRSNKACEMCYRTSFVSMVNLAQVPGCLWMNIYTTELIRKIGEAATTLLSDHGIYQPNEMNSNSMMIERSGCAECRIRRRYFSALDEGRDGQVIKILASSKMSRCVTAVDDSGNSGAKRWCKVPSSFHYGSMETGVFNPKIRPTPR